MKLYRESELPADPQGLWCRQSRFAGIVRCIVFVGIVSVPPVLGWNFHRPWVQWIGAAVAVVFIPLMLMDVAALLRATNWVLRIDTDGLWINLRSYKDRAALAPSVVHLVYREIASAAEHTESYTTPSKTTGPASYGTVGGSTIWRDRYLEIQLAHEQTGELKAALHNLRHQRDQGQPSSRYFPVWLVTPSLLRIIWTSGHGHMVVPRIVQVLDRLQTYLRIAEPTRRERPDWRQLAPLEAEELARELVHVHGASLEATALLVRAGGLNHSQATMQVRQFEEDGRQAVEGARV